jgi:hypothetical protein
MLRHLIAVAIASATFLFVPGIPSVLADGGCQSGTTTVQTNWGVVCVVVADPGHPGNSGTPGEPAGGGHRPDGCYKATREEVPCSTDLGTWWPGHQCYAEPSDAPAGSPAWQGHTDGSLWACSSCVQAANANSCQVNIVWLPSGQEPGPPDPGQLAAVAAGELPLAAAQVHTAPQAPDHTYIGIENWLWVPQAQWTTLSRTVTAGGTSVTVSATPSQVRWDMGPATKTCYAPGTVWRVGMTDAAQTNCGYTYSATSDSEPHGRFSVSATIRYQVDWTCTGACSTNSGTLGLVDAPTGVGTLQVLQRQTVVVRVP